MNQNLKNLAYILFTISVVIFIGLSSYWKFATWQVIDWIIIIVNIVVGGYLLKYSKESK